MNINTFFICKPSVFTFRVLGFGVFACRSDFPLPRAVDGSLWLVQILPNWRMAFLWPWH